MSYYLDDWSSSDGYDYAPEAFECLPCDRAFSSARSLSQHNQAVHRFECGRCSRVFSSARALQQHAAVKHAHHCDTCGRDFQNASNLAQHTQTHRPRQTSCPGCGQMYRGWTDASLHFETGHCPGCPGRNAARRKMYELVSAADRGFLSRPLMIGYGGRMEGGFDEDGANYNCKCCGREFKAMGSLLQHCDARPQCHGGNGGFARLRVGV